MSFIRLCMSITTRLELKTAIVDSHTISKRGGVEPTVFRAKRRLEPWLVKEGACFHPLTPRDWWAVGVYEHRRHSYRWRSFSFLLTFLLFSSSQPYFRTWTNQRRSTPRFGQKQVFGDAQLYQRNGPVSKSARRWLQQPFPTCINLR